MSKILFGKIWLRLSLIILTTTLGPLRASLVCEQAKHFLTKRGYLGGDWL
jgi:hypothetical protein